MNDRISDIGDDPNALRAAKIWGLREDLSWEDAVDQALSITRSAGEEETRAHCAVRLLNYLKERQGMVSIQGQPSAQAIAQFKAQLSKIQFHPARDPLTEQEIAVFAKDQVEDGLPKDGIPRGRLVLHAADKIYKVADAKFVWAKERACIMAEGDVLGQSWEGFLTYKPVKKRAVAEHILQLARASAHAADLEDAAAVVEWVECHLLRAVEKLGEGKATKEQLGVEIFEQDIGGKLAAASWVPCYVGVQPSLSLLPPGRVALKLQNDLWPRFGRLADTWNRAGTLTVLQAAGVGDHIAVEALGAELRELKESYPDQKPLNAADLKLAIGLASELAYHMPVLFEARQQLFEAIGRIYAPTASSLLLPARQVFINDAKWQQENHVAELLHDELSPAYGRVLGCSSVRQELARQSQEGEDFGQREDLANRIESIISAQEHEADVFIEHYQNCDDAGASRVLFFLDQRSYPIESVVTEEAAALQDPALVLGSDYPLKDWDLKRIQKLGDSAKRDSFSKVGRFGVGLNVLYHISDTIQIHAKDLALVVLDPLHSVIDRDGVRYNSTALRANCPNMLAPFDAVHFSSREGSSEEDGDDGDWPALFRLPLRKKGSNFGAPISVNKAMDMMNRFMNSAAEVLLFAKSVKQLEFRVRNDDGSDKLLAIITRDGVSVKGLAPFMGNLPDNYEKVSALQTSPRTDFEEV